MGMKLSPKEQELYQRVDEILHYIWDPINIKDEPAARDEYHKFLPQVYSMVKADASVAEIADHLWRIEKEQMEIFAERERLVDVAEVLLAARDHFLAE